MHFSWKKCTYKEQILPISRQNLLTIALALNTIFLCDCFLTAISLLFTFSVRQGSTFVADHDEYVFLTHSAPNSKCFRSVPFTEP